MSHHSLLTAASVLYLALTLPVLHNDPYFGVGNAMRRSPLIMDETDKQPVSLEQQTTVSHPAVPAPVQEQESQRASDTEGATFSLSGCLARSCPNSFLNGHEQKEA